MPYSESGARDRASSVQARLGVALATSEPLTQNRPLALVSTNSDLPDETELLGRIEARVTRHLAEPGLFPVYSSSVVVDRGGLPESVTLITAAARVTIDASCDEWIRREDLNASIFPAEWPSEVIQLWEAGFVYLRDVESSIPASTRIVGSRVLFRRCSLLDFGLIQGDLVVLERSTIGSHATLEGPVMVLRSAVEHQVVLSAFVVMEGARIRSHGRLCALVDVQPGTSIGSHCGLLGTGRHLDRLAMAPGTYDRVGVRIGRDNWIGQGVSAIGGTTTGPGVVVSAGTCLYGQAVAGHVVVAGNPPRIHPIDLNLRGLGPTELVAAGKAQGTPAAFLPAYGPVTMGFRHPALLELDYAEHAIGRGAALPGMSLFQQGALATLFAEHLPGFPVTIECEVGLSVRFRLAFSAPVPSHSDLSSDVLLSRAPGALHGDDLSEKPRAREVLEALRTPRTAAGLLDEIPSFSGARELRHVLLGLSRRGLIRPKLNPFDGAPAWAPLQQQFYRELARQLGNLPAIEPLGPLAVRDVAPDDSPAPSRLRAADITAQAPAVDGVRDFMLRHLKSVVGRDLGSSLDTPFHALGVDSLAVAELSALLVQHYPALPAFDPFAQNSIGKLLRALFGDSHGVANTDHHLGFRSAPVTTLVQQIAGHARSMPDRNAIVFPSAGPNASSLTWAQLYDTILRVGTHLVGRGVGPGDPIGVLAADPREQVLGFLGAMAAGAVPFILSHPSIKQSEDRFGSVFGRIVGQSCARWVLATAGLAAQVASWSAGAIGAIAFPEASTLPPAGQLPPQSTEGPAFIQYSSGTTSLRKGVRVSHRMLDCQARSYAEAMALSTRDTVVSWLPLYHDMGLLACLLIPLFHGVASVHVSPFEWIKAPHSLFQLIDDHGGTLVWMPNFAFKLLAVRVRDEQLTGISLASLRGFVNCGEPVTASAVNAFVERFAAVGVRAETVQACYAMAENTYAVSQTRLAEPIRVARLERAPLLRDRVAIPSSSISSDVVTLLSSGRPIAGTEVRIAGSTKKREVGEIELRGGSVIGGYLDARTEVERNVITEDGWCRTGDLGYLDDGELFVTGRAKDVIIHAGANLYPHEVEEVIDDVAGCKKGRVVVFGHHDEILATEQVIAMLEHDGSVDVEALRSAVRARVFEALGITLWDIVCCSAGTLLKSTSGKLSRVANYELCKTIPSSKLYAAEAV